MAPATVRERLGNWIAGRAGTQPISQLPLLAGQQTFGTGLGSQPTHETLLRESLGIFDAAVRAIANRISSLSFQVVTTRRVRQGTTVDEILDDHVLAELLRRPHPDLSMGQLLRLTAQHIVTTGEGYWLKIGSRLGVPVELHPLLPQNVFPQYTAGVVTGYQIRDGQGQYRPLPADTVVRFYFPDPEGFWGSEGYLGPTAIAADGMKFAEQHLRKHYQSDATPKTALEAGESAESFDADESERFNKLWQQYYNNRAGQRTGSPAILPLGYKLIQMAMQTGSDMTPLLEFWRDELLLSVGTPRSVLGQVVSGDRSSAETNEWVFDKHTVQPVACLIEDALTLRLAPDFDPSLSIRFEPFVTEDKSHQLALEQSDLDRKVSSINEVREGRGLDPVPWGELPVGKIGDAPYDGEEPEPMGGLFGDPNQDSEEPEGDPDPMEPEGDRKRGRGDELWSGDEAWLRQVEQEKAFIPTFLRAVRQVFREQESSVLERLSESRSRSHTRVNVDDLFDIDGWNDLFALRLEPIRELAYTAALAQTLELLGIVEFDFTEQARQALVRDGAKMVSRVNDTTRKAITRELLEANDAGEGVDKIANRIRGVFRERRRNHARTIARTETLKATSRATLDGFETGGVERKRWVTSRDDAVRDDHKFAEGQTRDVGEPFDLGNGEQADSPRIGVDGGELSAGNTINCRCTMVPVRG